MRNGLPVSYVRFDLSEKVGGREVSSDENGVVDLSESEQLQDLLFSWSDGVDTLGPDH